MSTLIQKRDLLSELQSSFNQRGFGKNLKRSQAFELFLSKGLPGSKTEEYKFFPITKLLEKVLELPAEITSANPAPASLHAIGELKCNVVAFVNGVFSLKHSHLLDADLKIELGEAGEAFPDRDAFDLLNQAFAESRVNITVESNKIITHPVAIVYYFDSPQFVFANPRWCCHIGTQSSITLIEYTINNGESRYFNNKQSVIRVGENSHLEYTNLQNGPATDIQLNNSFVHLSATATASCFTFTFHGELIRNNLTVTIDGKGIDSHLFGLYALSKSTHADNHTVVDHREPNSVSNELYKGVLDGNSKGVFNGKIYVRPKAQKTNAYQTNRNLLLSDSATVNTKPQLEIWADDVKCSHGCTTGQLDDEALFYLRSRGISKEMAKGMLLYAFAIETVASMKNETIKIFVEALMAEKLNKNF